MKLNSNFFSSLLYILLVSGITYLGLRKALNFDFWRDDWGYLWAARYHPEYILTWTTHPGAWVEDVTLIKVFGWNSVAWQLFGILLRICASLSLIPMMWILSKSKKIALISGLFFASSFIGIEGASWVSAHMVLVSIILINSGVCLWAYYLERRRYVYFLLAVLILDLAVLADPGRSVLVVFLLFVWEVFYKRTNIEKDKNLNILSRLSILVASFLFISHFLYYGPGTETQFFSRTNQILQETENFNNFLSSISNMIFGWIIHIPEAGGLALNGSFRDFASLLIITFTLFYSLIIGWLRKSRLFLMVVFFIVWMLVMYLPNWIFERTLVVAGSHRYLALAGVGFIGIIAIIVGRIRQVSLMFGLIIIFIALNICTSNRILENDSHFRSKEVVSYMWNKIDNDVPSGEKDSIFMYLGSDYLKGTILDWSGSIPFGIRRELRNVDDFPIASANKSLIVQLLCKNNVERPSIGKWSIQKTPIALSHVHAWEIERGIIANVSKSERAQLELIALAQQCKPIK